MRGTTTSTINVVSPLGFAVLRRCVTAPENPATRARDAMSVAAAAVAARSPLAPAAATKIGVRNAMLSVADFQFQNSGRRSIARRAPGLRALRYRRRAVALANSHSRWSLSTTESTIRLSSSLSRTSDVEVGAIERLQRGLPRPRKRVSARRVTEARPLRVVYDQPDRLAGKLRGVAANRAGPPGHHILAGPADMGDQHG